jgi:hypothetical protein
MKKYVKVLMVSTLLISPGYAMKTDKNEIDENDGDAPSMVTIHQRNLASIIEQQKSISLQMANLQQQFSQLHPTFEKFLKSEEVIRELKKKSLRERITRKLQDRITKAGDVAVENEKKKWKSEKINNYRLHQEKVIHEIRRATDEGRTKFTENGVIKYEPREILIESQWLSIYDFRKKRNEEFDEKQRLIKKALFEKIRKEAEQKERIKIYKEQLQEIQQL